MKQQALTFTAIALLGLSACGSPETEETPAPANGQDGAARSSTGSAADDSAVEDLLDHVAAENDDSFEPEVETVPGDNLQLDSPLAEGSWSSAGVGGMEYGQEAMAPVAGLRCAADGSALIVSVPLPPDLSEMGDDGGSTLSAPPPPGGAGADAAGETGETPAETRTGSLITANGTVTGTFRPAETRDEWREMTISADEAVLDGLPRGGRIGVGLEGEQSRLMPVTGALISSLETCVEPAPAPASDADAEDGDDGNG